jgi:hypothetical protein
LQGLALRDEIETSKERKRGAELCRRHPHGRTPLGYFTQFHKIGRIVLIPGTGDDILQLARG